MGYSPGGGGGSEPSPATTVTGPDAYGASAVVGTGTTYARSDHDHGLPAAPAVPAAATTVTGPDAYGASAVVGTGTTYARSDHDHGLPANPVTSAASLAAIKASFTAANQIIKGTGNGTGELIDFDTTLNFQFGAKGDLFAGTGSGTGEKLGIGSAGTVLTVGGADASGLEWSAPATVPTASSTVTGPDSYGAAAAVGSATTFSRGDHNHGLPAAPAASALATARQVAIGTGPTTVVTYTPTVSGNFIIAIYFYVITATTNITITVTWTDATGAQTLTILNVVAETIGSYSITNFMVDDLATDAITVSMTAGTVSQVLASASILQG